MAHDHADLLRPLPAQAGVVAAPLAGSRSQSIQRLQVGLFGLAAMVLLVALANIIMSNAEQNQATVVPEAVPTKPGQRAQLKATDPLAEAGVVPDMPAETPVVVPPPPETGNAAPPQP